MKIIDWYSVVEITNKAFSVLADLIDDEDCELDHHGNCRAHGWLDSDIVCPHARAKELIEEVKEDRNENKL